MCLSEWDSQSLVWYGQQLFLCIDVWMICWFLSWNRSNANCLYHCCFSFFSSMNVIASYEATKTLPNIKRYLHHLFSIYISDCWFNCVSHINSNITWCRAFSAYSSAIEAFEKSVYSLNIEYWAVLKWSLKLYL